MKFKIIYDRPGRLRLRCGHSTFNAVQGYGISSAIRSVPGVTSVFPKTANGGLLITYEGGIREDILMRISSLDYNNLPESIKSDDETTNNINETFQNALLLLIGRRMIFRSLMPVPLSCAFTVYLSIKFIRKGISSLSEGRLDVDVLDAAAVMGAMAKGSYKTANSIMFLLNVSALLSEYTHKRAQNALARSISVNVDCVWLVRKERQDDAVPLSEIQIGDSIRVRKGGMIPVDGTVTSGEAYVNESSMTGEALSVVKSPGSSVYAGTTLEDGSLVVEVKVLPSEARITQIVRLIERSESLKAQVQSKAERLADSIVPLSFLAAVAALLFTRSAAKALSVLMIDYSCAIKFSTPIAVISAMREAAAHKILVKGGKFLELYAAADTIVFDKTGTLTNAVPKVSHIIAFDGYSKDEILRIAACLEEHFPHSVAKAIVREAEHRKLTHPEDHADVEYVVAHGIVSDLFGNRTLVGSAHFVFDDEGVPLPPEYSKIIKSELKHLSPVYVSIGGKLSGVICIEDPPRSDAKAVICKLGEMGINNVIMLTGDGENTAKAVCRELGIRRYHAQVLPEDKSRIIERLKKEGHTVIMVGDGINDSRRWPAPMFRSP